MLSISLVFVVFSIFWSVPSLMASLRALCLVVEAGFSLYLWTMVSRTKDYGIPRLCPRSLDTLEYDGCCSHVHYVASTH